MISKPTIHKGVQYRSKTEARWAAFFAHINLPCQYEPEMFGLPGGWYIPDFFLPKQKVWIEIKGSEDQMEPCKCTELVQSIGQPLFRIFGSPMPGRYAVRLFAPHRFYPKIRNGLFAEHRHKAGWWIADGDACTPFRIRGRGETGCRSELLIHSPRLTRAMEDVSRLFRGGAAGHRDVRTISREYSARPAID